MSNAGPGLSPNKQSTSGKVAGTTAKGETVSSGYKTLFNGGGPKAPSLPPGTGGSKGTGGRGREPTKLPGYTPPKWP